MKPWSLYLIKKQRQEMPKEFTLEYWIDEGWYVGRLREMPEVFSQGRTLEELEENIRDAYKLVLEVKGETPSPRSVQSKSISIEG